MGNDLKLEIEKKDQNDTIKRLTDDVATAEEILKTHVKQSEAKIEEKDKEIAEKQKSIEEKDKIIKENETAIEQKESIIKEKLSLIKDKDTFLKDKNDKIVLITAERGKLHDEVSNLKKNNKALRDGQEYVNGENGRLRASLAQKEQKFTAKLNDT